MTEQNNYILEDFKMTELGLLPVDWEVARMDDAADISMGQSPPSSTYNTEGNGLPFFQGKADFGDMYPVTRKWCTTPAKIAEPGDILLSVRAPIGDTNVAKERSCFGRGLAAIKANHRAEGKYLFYRLVFSKEILESKGTGTTFKEINKTAVISFTFPLPPLPEQKAIVKILSTIQRAIEVQDNIISAAKELKKSLMRHLFTHGPVPLTEADKVPLKETEIGTVPESWEVARLGDYIEKPEYGYTASASNEIDGYKYLRITDIQNGIVDWASVPSCDCPQDIVGKYKISSGDLLVARIGATTGKTYLVQECPNAVFASYLIRIRCKSSLSPCYLNHFTNTNLYWDQVNALKGDRLKQGINSPNIKGILVPLPSLSEQQDIAGILFIVAKKIETEDNIKVAFQTLFKSMLHDLMTGKVRVKDLEV
jgi:type I restriction enzyme S subunit